MLSAFFLPSWRTLSSLAPNPNRTTDADWAALAADPCECARLGIDGPTRLALEVSRDMGLSWPQAEGKRTPGTC